MGESRDFENVDDVLLALARGEATEDTVPAEEARSAPVLARGTQIGRYLVLDLLGRGGMGTVYSAYDPHLNRRIAVKVLIPQSRLASSEGRTRLLREAQALAQLSHPNVVPIYDVGALADEVFIAMELASGDTLRAWLRQEKRSWREILDVFLQAARGLAAAHAAGLIHRDFKPENVIVGEDGRVRVLDFGLARAAADPEPAEQTPISPISGSFTRSGQVLGTPAYMSPEQLAGRPLDARSDQFSFCLSLYEALYDRRPDDPPSAAPPGRAPARLHGVLLRGLSREREERFPDMVDLTAALERARRPFRRQWLIAGAVALPVLFGVVAALVAPASASLCEGPTEKLGRAWGPDRQAAVRAAFLATAAPYAPDAWRGVLRVLGEYTREWLEGYRAACEETRVTGTQSEELLDRRMGCLGRRLHALTVLTDVFTTADRKTVSRAISAARQLPSLDDCSAERVTGVRWKQPDPAVRALVDEARIAQHTAMVLSNADKNREAQAILERVLAVARAVEFVPLEGRALYMIGRIQVQLGHKDAVDTLYEAVRLLDMAGSDIGRSTALGILAHALGVRAGRTKEGLRLARQAEAVVRRIGSDRARLAEVHKTIGDILSKAGRDEEARVELEKAVELRRQTATTGTLVATSLVSLGDVYVNLGRYPDAERVVREALTLYEADHGPHHTHVASALTALANMLGSLSRDGEAVALYERALAIYKTVFGPRSPRVGAMLSNVSYSLLAVGRLPEALALAREAFQVWSAHKHLRTAVGHLNLGDVLARLGRHAEANRHLAQALAAFEKERGQDHPRVAETLRTQAAAARAQGQPARAVPIAQRAIRIATKTFGATHPDTVAGDLALGEALADLGDNAGARAALARAEPALEPGKSAAALRARAALLAARLLWRDGSREDALRRAREAKAICEQPGIGASAELQEIAAWLAAPK